VPQLVMDPIKFCEQVWPHIQLYDKQYEILYSVRDNDETYVPAGNALGKDFVSAICALWFFCSRRPGRVVTTSVKSDQLSDVLWGEIRRLRDTAAIRLPIQYNHLHIRQVYNDGTFVPLCELVGQVCNQGEALLGRHLAKTGGIPRTLAIFDEASGMSSDAYESSDTWTHRKLIIGNPYPCNNFFLKGVRGGILKRKEGGGLYRNIIRIKATDSPNVQLAQAEIAAGKKPSNRIIIPGVIDWETYTKRRLLWDDVRQCIGLDAEFYEGAETLMYPQTFLARAANIAMEYSQRGRMFKRTAKAIGVDPAEGGDDTVWCIADEIGVIKLISEKTPDTSIITSKSIALLREYNVPHNKMYFDRGGGGKQIADAMRAKGFRVKTVGFGEAATPPRKLGITTFTGKEEVDETRYVYKNKRAEMYGILRDLLLSEKGYGIPDDNQGAAYAELRRQLAPIPLLYDGEGRIYLPPKRKKSQTSNETTMADLIGCSPDEADATVLATYAIHSRSSAIVLKAI